MVFLIWFSFFFLIVSSYRVGRLGHGVEHIYV